MLIELENVSFRYPGCPWILEDVSLTIGDKERVGIVGPSGYGKSTLVQIMAGYLKPVSGTVRFKGAPLPEKGFCPVQLVWQHPETAVNSRWKMDKILSESWMPNDDFLKAIGIEKDWLTRWPIELSGGELQRFCIARALSPKTELIIADEMTTMLDVITQAQIWDFVTNIVREREMGMIVVTHNPALAERVCDRIIDLQSINKIQIKE